MAGAQQGQQLPLSNCKLLPRAAPKPHQNTNKIHDGSAQKNTCKIIFYKFGSDSVFAPAVPMASLVGEEPPSNEEKDGHKYEDIEITTALIRRTTNSTSFLGMPRMQLRFWRSFSQVKAFAHMVMQMEQHT